MALVNTNQHGATYKWGTTSSDAPSITGFYPHTAEVKYAPEVNSTAQGGEGQVLAVAITKPVDWMWDVTITGFVDINTWNPSSLAEFFSWSGRFFLISDISEPRKRGEFWEVVITAKSFANVTS